MHHRTSLMVLALSVVLLACGDEDDGYSKKDSGGGGRPRSSSGGGKPGTGSTGSSDEDAGDESEPEDLDGGEPEDLDGGEPDELDGAASSRDTGATATDANNSGGDSGRDARADAEPAGSDGGGGVCAAPGESCEMADCCAEATCIIEPETGDPVCAAGCSAPSECNSGCCLSVRDSDVGACGPARYCEAPPIPMGGGCGGLVLIAEDGTFLGDAVSNRFAADGVCNEFSPHGSEFAANSIFNEFGTYGSEFAAQSAYNRFTSTPPALFCLDSYELVAFVTKNQFVTGAPLIDPDALCIVLANSGL